jgi:hypothetical protein
MMHFFVQMLFDLGIVYSVLAIVVCILQGLFLILQNTDVSLFEYVYKGRRILSLRHKPEDLRPKPKWRMCRQVENTGYCIHGDAVL